MRDDLDRLLRDATLTTIAFAIALGWALYQLAHGIAQFLDGLTMHTSGAQIPYSSGFGLTWFVHGRPVSLDGVFIGLIELVFVLLVAMLVRRRFTTSVHS